MPRKNRKTRLTHHIKNEDDSKYKRLNDEDEEYEEENEDKFDDDDDDDFDEDKLTEESYRTTFDTDPEELALEAEDVSDDDNY